MNTVFAFSLFGFDLYQIMTFLFLVLLPVGLYLVAKSRQSKDSTYDKWGNTVKGKLSKPILGVAVLSILLGVGMLAMATPVLAKVFVYNFDDAPAVLKVGEIDYKIPANDNVELKIKSKEDSLSFVASMGEEEVFQGELGEGTYLVNVSSKKTISVEHFIYSQFPSLIPDDDFKYFDLIHPGIIKISEDLDETVYGLAESPPEEVRLTSGTRAESYNIYEVDAGTQELMEILSSLEDSTSTDTIDWDAATGRLFELMDSLGIDTTE